MVPRQPTLDTLSASTGYVWFRYSQHSTRSQPPQGMCGIETANTRHALSLHRVCEVPRPPQISTRSEHPQGMCGAETDQHSTRSHPPQGMCGSETANTRYALSLHRVCVVPRQPTLDTLSASTGYVWYRDSQHSTRSQPPQGMCGSEIANTRHALSLHRVCEVPRPPQISTRSEHPQGMCGAETDQHSTCSQPPQGMCGSETANTRHALSLHRVCAVPRRTNTRHALRLHRVCVVPRQPTLETLSASTGYVWCRDSQHSKRSQPPQGM